MRSAVLFPAYGNSYRREFVDHPIRVVIRAHAFLMIEPYRRRFQLQVTIFIWFSCAVGQGDEGRFDRVCS